MSSLTDETRPTYRPVGPQIKKLNKFDAQIVNILYLFSSGFPQTLSESVRLTTHFGRCKIRSVDKIFAFLSSHLSLPLRRTNTGRNRIELGSPKGMQTVTFKMPNRRYAARKTCLPSFHNSCSPFSALLYRHVNKLIPL